MTVSHTNQASPTAGGKTSPKSPGPKRWLVGPTGGVRQEILLGGIIIVLLIVFSVTGTGFLSTVNIGGMAQDVTETAVLAIAETFVITMAGIDLSVGAILGLSGIVGALTMNALVPRLGDVGGFFAGAVIAILIGALVGLVNGSLIVFANITPFIATLATLGIATGLTLVLTNGIDIQGVPAIAVSWGNDVFASVLTIPVVLTIIAAIIGGICLHKTRFGRWTFAIGSNPVGARGAGLPITKHTISVYVLSGMLSAFAGVLVLMRLGTGSPTEGTNDELNAIAAVVIGGASLFGGVSTMLGSILGAIVLEIVLSGLIISGVPPYWQTVVTGVLIAAAVGFQELSRRKSRRTA